MTSFHDVTTRQIMTSSCHFLPTLWRQNTFLSHYDVTSSCHFLPTLWRQNSFLSHYDVTSSCHFFVASWRHVIMSLFRCIMTSRRQVTICQIMTSRRQVINQHIKIRHRVASRRVSGFQFHTWNVHKIISWKYFIENSLFSWKEILLELPSSKVLNLSIFLLIDYLIHLMIRMSSSLLRP